MATMIMMQHPQTGIRKKGFYGVSWTTLFFGCFPALFRGDLKTGLMVALFQVLTSGFAGIIWAFFYNKRYTLHLVERGYLFVDTPEANLKAREALGITDPRF